MSDEKVLEFVFFCVENIAKKLNKNVVETYDELAQKSDLLQSYIVANYDVLHTQSKDYIVDDIINVMRETGLEVMTANPVLLQKKYTRIVSLYANKYGVPMDKALDLFYHSETYQLMSQGIADMHCMSDEYLVEELYREIKSKA